MSTFTIRTPEPNRRALRLLKQREKLVKAMKADVRKLRVILRVKKQKVAK